MLEILTWGYSSDLFKIICESSSASYPPSSVCVLWWTNQEGNKIYFKICFVNFRNDNLPIWQDMLKPILLHLEYFLWNLELSVCHCLKELHSMWEPLDTSWIRRTLLIFEQKSTKFKWSNIIQLLECWFFWYCLSFAK